MWQLYPLKVGLVSLPHGNHQRRQPHGDDENPSGNQGDCSSIVIIYCSQTLCTRLNQRGSYVWPGYLLSMWIAHTSLATSLFTENQASTDVTRSLKGISGHQSRSTAAFWAYFHALPLAYNRVKDENHNLFCQPSPEGRPSGWRAHGRSTSRGW